MIAEARYTGHALEQVHNALCPSKPSGWERMLISEESDRPASPATLRDLMPWFGADDAKLAGAERFFEELVECVGSFVAATPTLLAWGERLHSLSQGPETPGHEKLFMERLGYDWLRSRLMTRAVHRLGKVLADEINQGRRVRAIIDEIVKAKDCSTLVISRRAKRFRDECDSHGAHVAINKAVKQTDLSMDATEFNQLIEAACQRDQGACRELARTAELLRPHLRGKNGRPISLETCIHIMFQRHLEYAGVQGAYTYSEIEGDDFVDPVTQATRLAVNNSDFSPLYANRLRKDKGRVPGIRTAGSGRK
jgi:hypothetical protein